MNTYRIYEIAKELNITTKEVIDKFDSLIGVKVKSHSSVVMPSQYEKFIEAYKSASGEAPKKPKAFVVKKTKHVEAEKPAEDKKTVTEEKPPEVKVIKKQVIKKVVKPVEPKPEVTVMQVARKSRESVSDIVEPEVKKVVPQKVEEKPAVAEEKKEEEPQRPIQQAFPTVKVIKRQPRPQPVLQQKDDKTFVRKPADKSVGDKKDRKFAGGNNQRQPIKRHIIPQDIYDGRGSENNRRNNNNYHKKKEKDYKSKEELQEMISLEKAAAQKHRKKTQQNEVQVEVTQVVINQPITVGDLADKINKSPAEIVKALMMKGVLATVNQVIDEKTAKTVCEEFGLEVLAEDLDKFIEEELQKEEKEKKLADIDEKSLKKRAPVVSIMGHVDHGKTTLLDSIRASKHKIVSTEVGGITQSIGAYTVYLNDNKDKKIVFVDTPGHEAFTEMRARGAKATDIAILVVAADDGIMPQTIEAIAHARAAEVPIIVAVNKIDKPSADPDKILQQLTEHGLVPEAWGGDTITVKVSALHGTGIDELLEYILLLAEVQDLKANPKMPGSGVVIEANLDKGKGPVGTFLVQNGTLKVGDSFVVGTVGGKVRALLSDSGERVKKAGPSTPVEILGLAEVPQAGDYFEVVASEKEMRQIVQERKTKERQTRLEAMLPSHVKNEVVGSEDEIQKLNLIIKANTNGAAEAVAQAVQQLESKEIFTKLVHVGVGDISEADVMLAAASNAIILGFTVKEDTNAMLAAEREHVVIKKYNIIYQVLEDLEKTMLNLLMPEIQEVYMGTAEVRQVFTIGKMVKIAGCYVTEGKIVRSKNAVLIRNGVEIFKGQIDQLKRFKDDVKEVAQGFECGISFAKFNDLQEGDIIKVTSTEEVERTSLV